jgi:hypothetical protein
LGRHKKTRLVGRVTLSEETKLMPAVSFIFFVADDGACACTDHTADDGPGCTILFINYGTRAGSNGATNDGSFCCFAPACVPFRSVFTWG